MEEFKITFEYLELEEFWCAKFHYKGTSHSVFAETKWQALDKISKAIKFYQDVNIIDATRQSNNIKG